MIHAQPRRDLRPASNPQIPNHILLSSPKQDHRSIARYSYAFASAVSDRVDLLSSPAEQQDMQGTRCPTVSSARWHQSSALTNVQITACPVTHYLTLEGHVARFAARGPRARMGYGRGTGHMIHRQRDYLPVASRRGVRTAAGLVRSARNLVVSVAVPLALRI